MDVFELRDRLVDRYRRYATSFLRISDERVDEFVNEALSEQRLWPAPQIGLNPAFEPGGTIDDLADDGLLHDRCRGIFRIGKSSTDLDGRSMTLHRHQTEAIEAAKRNRNYVLTTGTGSGKSLSYIVPIVDHVLRTGSGQGVKAVVVYPMNALANSQLEELGKFLDHGPWQERPVTFARYTGQDGHEAREQLQQNPPDVILTNYVMLELILTRHIDKRLVQNFKNLRYLVLDELHSYRDGKVLTCRCSSAVYGKRPVRPNSNAWAPRPPCPARAATKTDRPEWRKSAQPSSARPSSQATSSVKRSGAPLQSTQWTTLASLHN